MPAVKGKKLKPNICPLCNENCGKRLTKFEKHLTEVHNLSSQELWDQQNGGPVLCRCGCGQPTVWYGWTRGYGELLRGHNANLIAVHGEKKAREIAEKRAKSLRGRTGWAKGLTKETDARIKKRASAISQGRKAAFERGDIQVWNKGLTKESDPRVAQAANRIKNDFAVGCRQAWHAGLSEATDERIRAKNEDLRRRYANGELVPWHKGLTKEDDPRIGKTWELRDPASEYAHVRWSHKQIKNMLAGNTALRLERIENYRNDRKPALWVRCSSCDWFEKVALVFACNDRCPRCAPSGSIGQHEVSDWIESLGVDIGRNVRGIIGRRELDIFIPAHGLAIEYNGLYWHSEQAGCDERYHQDKTDACREVGIRLFHIFEDEWRDRPEIIKSMLRHRMDMSTQIGARECTVREVAFPERRKFFNANHIDGDTKAKHALGLEHPKHGLVMVLSLRKPFHRRYCNTLEIARVSSKQGYGVTGGLGRLTSHAVRWAQDRGAEKLISYVDLRHGGDSQGWARCGWQRVSQTPSRFWWTDFKDRYDRFRYRADRTSGMSEAQVAKEADVVKIWGCANLLLETA